MAARTRRKFSGQGRPRYAHRWRGRPGQRRQVYAPQDRVIGVKVIELRDQYHMSWQAIEDFIEEILAEREGRKPAPRGWRQATLGRWTKQRLQRAYEAERELQAREAATLAEREPDNETEEEEGNPMASEPRSVTYEDQLRELHRIIDEILAGADVDTVAGVFNAFRVDPTNDDADDVDNIVLSIRRLVGRKPAVIVMQVLRDRLQAGGADA